MTFSFHKYSQKCQMTEKGARTALRYMYPIVAAGFKSKIKQSLSRLLSYSKNNVYRGRVCLF